MKEYQVTGHEVITCDPQTLKTPGEDWALLSFKLTTPSKVIQLVKPITIMICVWERNVPDPNRSVR